MPDFSCNELVTQEACEQVDGEFQGIDTACADVDCVNVPDCRCPGSAPCGPCACAPFPSVFVGGMLHNGSPGNDTLCNCTFGLPTTNQGSGCGTASGGASEWGGPGSCVCDGNINIYASSWGVGGCSYISQTQTIRWSVGVNFARVNCPLPPFGDCFCVSVGGWVEQAVGTCPGGGANVTSCGGNLCGNNLHNWHWDPPGTGQCEVTLGIGA